jgi:DNA-3-methyladenine glycosylase
MINFVTNETDIPAAVLIRSCEALYGLDIIQERRQRISSPDLLSGPGKVGQALAFTRSACGHALFKPGTFEVHNAAAAQNIIVGPRVGIDYAAPKDRDALYRFADGDSFCVTKRSALRKPQEANF